MKLVKYRDAGLPTFTYFWVTEKHIVVSPYFNSEKDAEDWLKSQPDSEDVVIERDN